MKKTFNIKFISMIILVFVCFLACNTKVEARNICYYRDHRLKQGTSTYSNATDLQDADTKESINRNNIFIQLTFDNGKASFTYYDKATKKSHRALVANNDGDDYIISSESGKSLTTSDFNSGCPAQINQMISSDFHSYIFDIFKQGSEYYNAFYGDYTKTYLNTISDKIPGNTCYQKNHDENQWCNMAAVVTLSDTITESGHNCSYVNLETYGNGGIYQIDTHLILSIDSANKRLSAVRQMGDTTYPKLSFNYDNISRCPNTLYLKNGVLYLSKYHVSSDEGTLESYALIKNIKKGDVEKKADSDNGCKIFGSAEKYIRMAYKFLKYAIPVLIIIFSVFDFLGVVFSGESEKMEKAKSKFIKRLIIGVIILLLPSIIEFILKLAGINGGHSDLPSMVCNWLS